MRVTRLNKPPAAVPGAQTEQVAPFARSDRRRGFSPSTSHLVAVTLKAGFRRPKYMPNHWRRIGSPLRGVDRPRTRNGRILLRTGTRKPDLPVEPTRMQHIFRGRSTRDMRHSTHTEGGTTACLVLPYMGRTMRYSLHQRVTP